MCYNFSTCKKNNNRQNNFNKKVDRGWDGCRTGLYNLFLEEEKKRGNHHTRSTQASTVVVKHLYRRFLIIRLLVPWYKSSKGANGETRCSWRCCYLLALKQKDMKRIIWLEKTRINAGHCEIKDWIDGTEKRTVGRGDRLIAVHLVRLKAFFRMQYSSFVSIIREIITKKRIIIVFTNGLMNSCCQRLNHISSCRWIMLVITRFKSLLLIIMSSPNVHSELARTSADHRR